MVQDYGKIFDLVIVGTENFRKNTKGKKNLLNSPNKTDYLELSTFNHCNSNVKMITETQFNVNLPLWIMDFLLIYDTILS